MTSAYTELHSPRRSKNETEIFVTYKPVAPVAQRYHVTSDTLGREFDPGKRDFSHKKTRKQN